MKKECAVLVSGGVDSSVALRLLQQEGYTPTAFYLKIWLEDELAYLGTCPWQEDLAYVEAVCAQAKVPLQVISLQKEYWEQVVAHTLSEIKSGGTPNPDILCNQRVKFGAFYEYLEPRFEFVATGHYARIERDSGRHELHTTNDPVKDQTYFLSHLNQAQLSRVLFPLGNLTKASVRELAAQFELPNRDRKDSQGICFLGKLKFSEFVKHHMGEQEGSLIEMETGKEVGTHKGFWFYTVGQRQGIGLSGGPWYVVAKNIRENKVFISRQYYTEDKMRDTFLVKNCNWIICPPEKETLRVKLRHGAHFNSAKLEKYSDISYLVKLSERDQGLAEGQYAVFYEGTQCLGGGVIQRYES
jgi:tRNA (5-methylaminomethyl-2-thiouridylate)-methyltransferase